MDDWKGEHLIRGIKPTPAMRHSENSRTMRNAEIIMKRRAGEEVTPLKTRREHSTFVRTLKRKLDEITP